MKLIFSAAFLFLITAISCKKQGTQVDKNAASTVGLDEDQNTFVSEKAYQEKTRPRTVSPETIFTYDGKTVRVKAYSRDVGENNVTVFKYGDLINRAIAYKTAHPSTTVTIRFAMYQVSNLAYIGFDPSHSSYGYVKGNDFGGDHSEKLIWSIVKAAKNEVYIDFVYHKDKSGDAYDYISQFLNDPCYTNAAKKVTDYLKIRQIGWGESGGQQMHAKFMTVSHYAGNSGGGVLNTVYCTSANVDSHDSNGIPSPNYVQSGILINGHPELMASYNQYFDLIYNNHTDQTAFRTAVRAAHSTNSLNYDDYHFSSYFYPIPTTFASNAWDTSFNPVAKYVSQMAAAPNKYMKANVYYLGADFGKTLYDSLYAIYHAPGTGIRDFKFVVADTHTGGDSILSKFNNIGIIKYPKHTHSKDVLFAFSKFYTITGSANLTRGEYTIKANTNVVVKEYTAAHPVYNSFKAIYSYQY